MESNKQLSESKSIGQCRFCRSTGFHRTLIDEYKAGDGCEIYFDMIQECFNLHVSTGADISCLICEHCINRLKDSLGFQKMVIDSEIFLRKAFSHKLDLEVDDTPEYLEIKSDKFDKDLESDDYNYQILADGNIDERIDYQSYDEIPKEESDPELKIKNVESVLEENERPASLRKSKYSEDDIRRAAEAVQERRMNYSQASRYYKVPRTSLQAFIIKSSPEIKIENVESLLDENERPASLRKSNYSEDDIRKAAEAVQERRMNYSQASRYYKVPRTSLQAFIIKSSPEIKIENVKSLLEENVRPASFRKSNYSEDDIRKAAEAVQERRMNYSQASRYYKVPRTSLQAFIIRMTNPDNVKTEKKRTLPPKPITYSEEDLIKAAEAVRDLKMTNTAAAREYNVPRTTLATFVLKNYGLDKSYRCVTDLKTGNKIVPGQPKVGIMVKHNTNITNIMEYTNATPIRCHSDAGYSCSFCTNQYMKPEDLKYHTIHAHDMTIKRKFTRKKSPSMYYVKLDITHLKCNICNVGLDSLENLMRHLNYEHDKKMYTDIQNRILPVKFETDDLKCAICGQIFGTFKILLMHMNIHYPNYVCKVCDGVFLTRTILLGHEKSHKSGVFKCDKCPKVFDNERTMKIHSKHVHEYSGYISKCGHCGERFKSYQAKIDHLNTAHNISKTFSCEKCDKTFKLQACLRLHWKRVHLMERSAKCDVCGKKFFNKLSLNKHMLKHSGIRRFQCELCLNSYQTQSTLREHIRIHKNDRRFKCEHCGMAFVQKCSWRAHMKNKHGVTV